MRRPRYFVILGAMRTGSNLLERTIAGLSGTVCHGEAFNPAFIGGPRRAGLPGWGKTRRDADPLGYLAAIRADAGDRLPGFRLFNGHDATILDHVAADPDCARIVLRRDPVDTWVSLRIARATDQWLLRNPRRRRTAPVHFDPDAFDRYRTELDAHYARLDALMAAAGQTALHLDYGDLSVPDLPDRLADFLGLPRGLSVPPDLLRQNPEPLSAKVSNYARMCAHLGLTPEVPPDEPLPGPDGFLCAGNAPVALAAIPGPGLVAGFTLLHRVDRRIAGRKALGSASIAARAAAGTLFPTGDPGARQTFAIVSHPARRLAHLLLDELAAGNSPARAALTMDHPDLPSAEDWPSWPAARRRDVLADFTDLVAGALAGTGNVPCRAAWRAQSDLLATMRPDDCIGLFRDTDLGAAMSWLCDAGGIAPFPRGQLKAILELAQPDPPDPGILDPGLTARIAALYPQDCEAFGYDPADPDG